MTMRLWQTSHSNVPIYTNKINVFSHNKLMSRNTHKKSHVIHVDLLEPISMLLEMFIKINGEEELKREVLQKTETERETTNNSAVIERSRHIGPHRGEEQS